MNSPVSGFCPVCKQQRLLLREKPNHILHLILTVLTVGLWGIVWLAIAATKTDARCATCGHAMRQYHTPTRGTWWA